MCSRPEHRVEVLPDGQIDEEHVFTDQEMASLVAAIDRTIWHLAQVTGVPITYFTTNAEEVPNG
jgi:hypothetical protein